MAPQPSDDCIPETVTVGKVTRITSILALARPEINLTNICPLPVQSTFNCNTIGATFKPYSTH